jgi:hypothetical protein
MATEASPSSVVEGDVGSARKLWRAAGAVRVHSEDATGAVIVADVAQSDVPGSP